MLAHHIQSHNLGKQISTWFQIYSHTCTMQNKWVTVQYNSAHNRVHVFDQVARLTRFTHRFALPAL